MLTQPLSQFCFVFYLGERSFIMNRNGGSTPEEAACLSPRKVSWSVTWLFSSVGHTIEMLGKAAHTTPD